MSDIQNQIDAGLEQAFAKHGFAEPNIETLRKATRVGLRTLYKYVPSRDVMILRALEDRHRRYMAHVFPQPETQIRIPLATIVDRVAQWMKAETTHGCLFHAAVASSPQDKELLGLLGHHKAEMANSAASASELKGREDEVLVIVEGLMQSLPLRGEEAVRAAKALGALICGGEDQ